MDLTVTRALQVIRESCDSDPEICLHLADILRSRDYLVTSRTEWFSRIKKALAITQLHRDTEFYQYSLTGPIYTTLAHHAKTDDACFFDIYPQCTFKVLNYLANRQYSRQTPDFTGILWGGLPPYVFASHDEELGEKRKMENIAQLSKVALFWIEDKPITACKGLEPVGPGEDALLEIKAKAMEPIFSQTGDQAVIAMAQYPEHKLFYCIIHIQGSFTLLEYTHTSRWNDILDHALENSARKEHRGTVSLTPPYKRPLRRVATTADLENIDRKDYVTKLQPRVIFFDEPIFNASCTSFTDHFLAATWTMTQDMEGVTFGRSFIRPEVSPVFSDQEQKRQLVRQKRLTMVIKEWIMADADKRVKETHYVETVSPENNTIQKGDSAYNDDSNNDLSPLAPAQARFVQKAPKASKAPKQASRPGSSMSQHHGPDDDDNDNELPSVVLRTNVKRKKGPDILKTKITNAIKTSKVGGKRKRSPGPSS